MAREVLLQSGGDACNNFRISWFMQVLSSISESYQNRNGGSRATIVEAIRDSIPARLFRLRNPPGYTMTGFRNRRISQPLFTLFSEYKTAECEDQRDKIFGLHSLAKDCCKKAVPVDYSLTWQVILASLVRHQTSIHPSLPKDIKSVPADSVIKHFRDF